MYNGGTYERLEFLNNMVTAVISGDDIIQCDMYGRSNTKIGVTLKKYNEATETLSKYYNKLVELGVIEEEKKPEDMMKEFMNELRTLRNEIKQLKEDKDDEHSERNATSSEQDVGSGPIPANESIRTSTGDVERSAKSSPSTRKSRGG